MTQKTETIQINFLNSFLNGISQIMLQENRLTGLLFLAGLFLAGTNFGISAIVACAVGTITAVLLKFDKKEIETGLYGFSPALAGVVLIFLFESSLIVWFLVIIGGALSAVLQHFFFKRNFPAYTFPFIFVSWILIFLIRQTGIAKASTFINSGFEIPLPDWLLVGTNGYAEVIFQSHPLTGIIFFVAVIISSRIAGLTALAASFIGAVLAFLAGVSSEDIFLGIYGFNPVLTAIVFAGNKKSDFLWVIIGVAITFFIQIALVNSEILVPFGGVLTFPFVAGTWVTLILQKTRLKKEIGQD